MSYVALLLENLGKEMSVSHIHFCEHKPKCFDQLEFWKTPLKRFRFQAQPPMRRSQMEHQ